MLPRFILQFELHARCEDKLLFKARVYNNVGVGQQIIMNEKINYNFKVFNFISPDMAF